MINIKDLDKTIEFLQELKKEEEKKQVEKLSDIIKEELVNKIKNELFHFESDKFVDFIEKSGLEVCFDYNFPEIMENIEKVIKVSVWQVN